ncbi:MAG TPA: LysM peptidoglycan-binding domain-containing protein [Bellilinea sp.]
MSGKSSPQSIIDSYKKRQRMMPFMVWGIAILLVLIGIILLVVWFTGPNAPKLGLFSSATPTASATPTVTPMTPSPTASLTPTITNTSAPTVTVTPSGPFEYTVKEGDTCFDLALTYDVDLLVLLALNNFAPNACPIRPGDIILIPAPGQALPTSTPLPDNMPRGTKINYVVQSGDTLASIASEFNSTVDDIMLQNKITDMNKINVGDTLIVRVNLVTPTPTRAPSLTPTPGGATATLAPTS